MCASDDALFTAMSPGNQCNKLPHWHRYGSLFFGIQRFWESALTKRPVGYIAGATILAADSTYSFNAGDAYATIDQACSISSTFARCTNSIGGTATNIKGAGVYTVTYQSIVVESSVSLVITAGQEKLVASHSLAIPSTDPPILATATEKLPKTTGAVSANTSTAAVASVVFDWRLAGVAAMVGFVVAT